MSYLIELHYDGEISAQHKMQLHDLASALDSIQSAINRSAIYYQFGNVWKNQRIPKKLQDKYSFTVKLESIEAGGFRFKIFGTSDFDKKVIDTIDKALQNVLNTLQQPGVEYGHDLKSDYQAHMTALQNGKKSVTTFADLIRSPPESVQRNYGEKSVSKEFDQLLSPMRAGQGVLELRLIGSEDKRFNFTQQNSIAIHKLLTSKELGDPVHYVAEVQKLDRIRKTAYVKNLDSEKKAKIVFNTEGDFLEIRNSFGEGETLNFVGCPIIEYGSFDPNGGDIYFLYKTEPEDYTDDAN